VAANEVQGPPTAGQLSGGAAGSVHRDRVQETGLVTVSGPLEDVAEVAHRALLDTLADDVTAVVCDLSEATGTPDSESTALLASVGSEVRQWPGTPVGMVCPTVRLREGISRHPDSRYLVLAARRRQVLVGLAHRPHATVVQASLPPVARSARAARDLVARTLLDWGCGPQIGGATLVVSELVTHAMLYADSDLLVTVARCGSQIRISVRDANHTNIHFMGMDASRVSHRGLMLVAAVSESWGVLPTSDGGKVVWAVLAANPPVARALGSAGGRAGGTTRPRRTSRPDAGR
jgi:hypothetical protein